MKQDDLLALARLRQGTKWPGFFSIGDFHDGAYDCDFVSPWSKSAHNTDCEVMLVAQDWASSDHLNSSLKAEVANPGYDPHIETNINLHGLLERHLGLKFSETHATNIFPFIKPGRMNAPIPANRYRQAGVEFLAPQIDILRPKLVICLGLNAFNGATHALSNFRPVRMAVALENVVQVGITKIIAVAHTGRLGTNNRGKENVERDWERLEKYLKE